MHTVHTLVVGAGQAGLAASRFLAGHQIDHAVLERGHVAERWRSERWDSLQLLTPNWASRLPEWSYRGPDPDGYMTAGDFARYLSGYAASFDAPVRSHSPVHTVRAVEHGFTVHAGDTEWHARNVVVATGWCDRPYVPELAGGLPADIAQFTATDYRNPAQLPDGAVLVVGASASGVQLADELARTGRDVVLAVGNHSRVPRRYRGMDIWWWLDRIGTFAKTIDKVSDPARARSEGALQLIGRDDHRDVDLPSLQAQGVQLAGRLVGADHHQVRFADDLRGRVEAADGRLARILRDIDDHIAANGLEREVLPPAPVRPVDLREPTRGLDLRRRGIRTVVWATGFRREYPWLHVPVLGRDGEIVQRRGVTPQRGLYVLGQRFQHRRDANFIDGVRHDAAYVVDHIATHHHDHQHLNR
jgi:putative flavoprotein involved in K+ transport